MLVNRAGEHCTGILLAAGRGTRFDSTGKQNKLMQAMPDGDIVAAAAAKTLLAVLPSVLAVVRTGQDDLARTLQSTGCRVTACPNADEGMAASLVHALSEARGANAWVIALGDMPFVRPETIHALVAAIEDGAQIAAPVFQGRRGNPVAFGRTHLDRLLLLQGDEGARRLLKTFPVTEIETDDAGVVRDIDNVDDLLGTR